MISFSIRSDFDGTYDYKILILSLKPWPEYRVLGDDYRIIILDSIIITISSYNKLLNLDKSQPPPKILSPS